MTANKPGGQRQYSSGQMTAAQTPEAYLGARRGMARAAREVMARPLCNAEGQHQAEEFPNFAAGDGAYMGGSADVPVVHPSPSISCRSLPGIYSEGICTPTTSGRIQSRRSCGRTMPMSKPSVGWPATSKASAVVASGMAATFAALQARGQGRGREAPAPRGERQASPEPSSDVEAFIQRELDKIKVSIERQLFVVLESYLPAAADLLQPLEARVSELERKLGAESYIPATSSATCSTHASACSSECLAEDDDPPVDIPRCEVVDSKAFCDSAALGVSGGGQEKSTRREWLAGDAGSRARGVSEPAPRLADSTAWVFGDKPTQPPLNPTPLPCDLGAAHRCASAHWTRQPARRSTANGDQVHKLDVGVDGLPMATVFKGESNPGKRVASPALTASTMSSPPGRFSLQPKPQHPWPWPAAPQLQAGSAPPGRQGVAKAIRVSSCSSARHQERRPDQICESEDQPELPAAWLQGDGPKAPRLAYQGRGGCYSAGAPPGGGCGSNGGSSGSSGGRSGSSDQPSGGARGSMTRQGCSPPSPRSAKLMPSAALFRQAPAATGGLAVAMMASSLNCAATVVQQPYRGPGRCGAQDRRCSGQGCSTAPRAGSPQPPPQQHGGIVAAMGSHCVARG